MDPSPSADETSGSELDRLDRELSAVAELGRLAARSARVQDFLEAAVRRVADVLEVDYSEMLELILPAAPGRRGLEAARRADHPEVLPLKV